MRILVFNCGSSSLKYKLIEIPEEKIVAGGEAQCVGVTTSAPSVIYHRLNDTEEQIKVKMKNHASAFNAIMKILKHDNKLHFDAVGHRVAHGGKYKDSLIITTDTIKNLNELNKLAPIHNPVAIEVIEEMQIKYPNLPQFAVFDTAYHSTIPKHIYTYPLPLELIKETGIRKYGFHGTSHNFVVKETAKFLKIPLKEFNAVSCHLGSGGASLCAVINGKSVDNTMGFSPLQGLIMNTRCGDLDPGMTMHILSSENADTTENILNRKSGIIGLSDISSDIRDIISDKSKSISQKTERIYLWRIKKYLGAYLTVVRSPHAIIFTDTIGETNPYIREKLCSDMSVFGIEIDKNKNTSTEKFPVDISSETSKVKIIVIETNEELEIARKSLNLFSKF